MRKSIRLGGTVMDMMLIMSEGNPGALSVLAKIMKDDPTGFGTVLHLDDMNIRGPQIWLGFKDFAGEDLDKFTEAVSGRSQEMVDVINGCHGSEPGELAVTGGASFSRAAS